jgi:hypothetical protein
MMPDTNGHVMSILTTLLLVPSFSCQFSFSCLYSQCKRRAQKGWEKEVCEKRRAKEKVKFFYQGFHSWFHWKTISIVLDIESKTWRGKKSLEVIQKTNLPNSMLKIERNIFTSLSNLLLALKVGDTRRWRKLKGPKLNGWSWKQLMNLYNTLLSASCLFLLRLVSSNTIPRLEF